MSDEVADKKVRVQRVLMGVTLTILFPFSLIGGLLIISATINWIDGRVPLIPFIGVSLLMLLPVLSSFLGKKLFRQLGGGYTRRIRRRLIEFYLSTLAGLYLFAIGSYVTVSGQRYTLLPQEASWVLILGLVPLLIVILTKADKEEYEVALSRKTEGALRLKSEEALRLKSEDDLRMTNEDDLRVKEENGLRVKNEK